MDKEETITVGDLVTTLNKLPATMRIYELVDGCRVKQKSVVSLSLVYSTEENILLFLRDAYTPQPGLPNDGMWLE